MSFNKQTLCMSKRRKAMRGQTSEFSTYKITGYGVDHRGILLIIMWKRCETHQMPSDPATARRFVTCDGITLAFNPLRAVSMHQRKVKFKQNKRKKKKESKKTCS